MTKTKTGRITSGFREIQTTPPGSYPPHMQHLKPKRRERPTERQRARKAAAVGEARINDTVGLVRSLETPARKRGGARYGQAPKNPPNVRMQAPKPMSDDRRGDQYTRGWRGMTARQLRQYSRMANRADNRDAYAKALNERDALRGGR